MHSPHYDENRGAISPSHAAFVARLTTLIRPGGEVLERTITVPRQGVASELSHAYRPDSHSADVTGKHADVIWIGCQDDPAACGGRSGDHDSIDGRCHACHSGEVLEPRCRPSDRIGEGNDLELLQYLVGSGVAIITHQSLGQDRCRDQDRNASLTRRRQDCPGIIVIIPRDSPQALAVEHNCWPWRRRNVLQPSSNHCARTRS
jgi:hypothetical protein